MAGVALEPSRFSTLMERAEVMTALRRRGDSQFPTSFEERVSNNAKKVIRRFTELWIMFPPGQ